MITELLLKFAIVDQRKRIGSAWLLVYMVFIVLEEDTNSRLRFNSVDAPISLGALNASIAALPDRLLLKKQPPKP